MRARLHDGGPLRAHVVDHGAPRLEGLLHRAAVDADAGHAVVLPLLEDVVVGGDVGREGVDGAPVVDDDEEEGKVLLRGRVEALRHPPVLRAALADEHDGDAIVVFRPVGVELPVEEDGARGAGGVRQLLTDESPAALEVCLLVVDVHRPARPAACAAVLCPQLRHDRVGRDALGEGVRVLAVVRDGLIAGLDRVGNQRRDRLLAVVQVHEAADVALHVRLRSGGQAAQQCQGRFGTCPAGGAAAPGCRRSRTDGTAASSRT